ncbi:glycoside hydrolase family 16 protein [Maribacter aquivivus]|uniref:glycoside hydrolase family 16 protein n=1 Tax=Maribacter aquivivus TaxID=228958 RepID=UPI0024911504|nr:glycoside hydrolase family 16 protein [Maribacter aquivivus]
MRFKENKEVIRNYILLLLLVLVIGCNKSDSEDTSFNEEDRVLIQNKINETDDVNAGDFWDEATLAWSDEFNGNELNKDNWSVEIYKGGQENTEQQDYTDENYEVSNGTLKISARKQIEDNTPVITSSRLHSKFEFKYGRIEYRVKLPAEKGNGLWAASWLLGSNFRTTGNEAGIISIMRYFSHLPNQVNSSIISLDDINNNNPNRESYSPITINSAEEEFHIYGMLWTNSYIKFYIDDINNITNVYARPIIANSTNWPFDNSFLAVVNMAVGGEFGGVEGVDESIFPNSFEVDYIRVYHSN